MCPHSDDMQVIKKKSYNRYIAPLDRDHAPVYGNFSYTAVKKPFKLNDARILRQLCDKISSVCYISVSVGLAALERHFNGILMPF